MKTGFKFNPLTALFDLVNKFTIRADGNPAITDPVQLISGSNISMVQIGNTIEISATNAPPVLTGYFAQEEYAATAGQVNFPLVATPLNGTQVFVTVRGQLLPVSQYVYNVGTNSVDISGGVPLNHVVSFYIGTGLNGVTLEMETAVGSGPNFPLVGTPINPSSVFAIVDGGFYFKSNFTYDVSDNEVRFNLSQAPNVDEGQIVLFLYQNGGTVLSASQERLLGVSNGTNRTFGPTRFAANEPESLFVLRNGRRVPYNQYTVMGKSIIFNVGFEPALGQKIEAFYFYASTGSEQTQYITLTQDQVDAKQFQLEFTPANPTEVMVDLKDPIPDMSYLTYEEDFEIEGNVIKWDGLGFDGIAAENMKIRLHYHI